MTTQSEIQRHSVEPTEAQLAALESTYPGWRIAYDATTKRWSAGRRAAITDAQANAGVVSAFLGGTYDDLASWLAHQAALVDQCGGYTS